MLKVGVKEATNPKPKMIRTSGESKSTGRDMETKFEEHWQRYTYQTSRGIVQKTREEHKSKRTS